MHDWPSLARRAEDLVRQAAPELDGVPIYLVPQSITPFAGSLLLAFTQPRLDCWVRAAIGAVVGRPRRGRGHQRYRPRPGAALLRSGHSCRARHPRSGARRRQRLGADSGQQLRTGCRGCRAGRAAGRRVGGQSRGGLRARTARRGPRRLDWTGCVPRRPDHAATPRGRRGLSAEPSA